MNTQEKMLVMLEVPEAAERILAEQLARFPDIALGGEGRRIGPECLKPRLGDTMAHIYRLLAAPLAPVGAGDFTLHPARRTLEGRGVVLSLTDRECGILAWLARNKGRAVSRDELLQNVFGYHSEADTHTLETHVYRLRQKLDAESATAGLIATVDGGYRLEIG